MGGGTEVLLSQCHPICLEVNGLKLLWIEMKINALTFFRDVCYDSPCVNGYHKHVLQLLRQVVLLMETSKI